jgi:FkbM family methyltransferase
MRSKRLQKEVYHDLVARLDRMEASQARLAEAVEDAIRREVDRLDGYLTYHHDRLITGLSQHSEPRVSYASAAMDAIWRTKEFDIVVPTAESALLAYISRHGFETIEPHVLAVIEAHVQPGATTVDVGSNIGIHALALAAAVGPSGSVTCFEPAPHIAKALERTLQLNGFSDRTRVHREAVTDIPGHVTFYRAHHGPMSSILSLPDFMAAEEFQVPATTLDDRIAPGSRVDFIKIDVEGAEPNVWRGMRRIIAENSQLQIALGWSSSHFQRGGCDPVAFMHDIRSSGFKPYLIGAAPSDAVMQPLIQDVTALEGTNLFLSRAELSQSVHA